MYFDVRKPDVIQLVKSFSASSCRFDKYNVSDCEKGWVEQVLKNLEMIDPR